MSSLTTAQARAGVPITDSATLVALKTNATLRTRFEQIANDTTTWGFVAGQAVLSRYLGYKFRPWYEGAPDPVYEGFRTVKGGGTLEAANTTAARMAATLSVYPNPATDAVELQYALPEGSNGGELVLRDRFGKECRRVALASNTHNLTLSLKGLLPGLYYYTYNVSEERVQAGTLMKQ